MVGEAVQLGTLLSVRQIADSQWHLTGEVDISNADALLDTLRSDQDATSDIVLDLTELTYIDSSGIRVIVVLLRELNGSARLVLRLHEGPVSRVIKISDLNSVPNLQVELIEARS